MLVNLLRGSGVSATAAMQSIRLDFNFGSSGINTLMRVNRLTGEPERVTMIKDGATQYHVFISLWRRNGRPVQIRRGGLRRDSQRRRIP